MSKFCNTKVIKKVSNDRCCPIKNSHKPLRPENIVRGNADFIQQSVQEHDGPSKTILSSNLKVQ